MSLLLNTLYITTPETSLHKEGETVLVKVQREKRLQVPLHHLQAITILAEAWISPELMRACLEKNISIALLNERGRFLGRVEGIDASGAWLRRNQMEAHLDLPRSLAIAKAFVKGKLANQRHILLRSARETDGDAADGLGQAAIRIQWIQQNVDRMETHDQVRGCEGEGAARYFEVFKHLIRQQQQGFPWSGRNRRPPKDALNAMLSFAYMLLMGDCLAACQSVGLDPAIGYLHAFRPGRPALALDLMETFRPIVADRLVLTLINNQQIRPDDFTFTESGAVHLNDDARKLVITTHQQRKAQTLRHPFLEQDVTWGMAPLLEARLFARHLRGDMEAFPPFHPRG